MSVQNKYPFYLSTVIGAILIGLAPILMRYSEVSPSMTGFYRFFFAFLILLIYGAIKGKKFDGSDFISEARENGAFLIIANKSDNKNVISTNKISTRLITNSFPKIDKDLKTGF